MKKLLFFSFLVLALYGCASVPSKETFLAPEPEFSFSLSGIKTIVVDAGHGGKDSGAIGKSGLQEKGVNLDIARRLTKLLINAGVHVVMTRSSDKFISLQRRVKIANDSGADLFISIHSNANHARSLNGFEVYFVSCDVSDIQRALVSARNGSDLEITLWDMTYASNRQESARLSDFICRAAGDLKRKVIGIKPAGFYVLKGCRMPAILIETAFLSNAEDERLLKDGFYRQQIAEAIEKGIKNYAREIAKTNWSL